MRPQLIQAGARLHMGQFSMTISAVAGSVLSDNQQQDPELLLVDEPTASLDPKTSRQIMRLLIEICAERGLPAIVNIHDVPLAQQFMQRIVGLRAGRVVFDGPSELLTQDALTTIYGEEDWNAMRKGDEEQSAAEADARDRIAALAQ